jgi:hypothetical protein
MTSSVATNDAVLHSIRRSTNALTRIMDLDVAGRTMVAFMRGHMAEIHQHQTAEDYFAQFYGSTSKEFVQFDDYGFVLHHCLRFLYMHWKEEVDALRAGPLGEVLTEIGGELPEMRERPSAPTRRPSAVQGSWYGEVYECLEQGVLPNDHGSRNEVVRPKDCVYQGEKGLDLIWGAFLVYACDVWARQIPLMWELVREAIATRRFIQEQMSTGQLAYAVSGRAEEYKTASREFTETFAAWQDYHATTVDMHDPMFDLSVAGLSAWMGSLTADLGSWTIKAILKDEMYRELASNILLLRGSRTTAELPAMNYWRTLHFAPRSNEIGALGMPPFDAPLPGFVAVELRDREPDA